MPDHFSLKELAIEFLQASGAAKLPGLETVKAAGEHGASQFPDQPCSGFLETASAPLRFPLCRLPFPLLNLAAADG